MSSVKLSIFVCVFNVLIHVEGIRAVCPLSIVPGQPATGEAAEIEQHAARNARARSRAKRLAEVADSRARLQANAYTGKQGAFTRHWDIMTVRKYRRPTMMEALTDYNKKNRRGS